MNDPIRLPSAVDLEHYIVRFRLNGETLFLLWHYGEPDGVLVNEQKKVVCFSSIALLNLYAEGSALRINHRLSDLYDLDYVCDWVRHPDVASMRAKLFLDTWNLVDDVRDSITNGNSVGQTKTDEQAVYEKLFAANTSVAELVLGHFDPRQWADREITLLAKVLRQGLRLFASSITRLQ